MKQQIRLLSDETWDVLVILDACRADAFMRITGQGQVVRSPANCTPRWCKAVLPILQKRGVRYVTGQPVVDRTYAHNELPICSVWRNHWARFGPENIPSVHPMSVTACAIEVAQTHVTSPLVVHYIQPHSPYIGTPPLAAARVSDGRRGPTHAMSELVRPDLAVASGPLTWADVRAAYDGNVRLGWQAVKALVAGLSTLGRKRRVIVTADHGELLGERGRFGHEAKWSDEELYRVPWLVMQTGDETDGVKAKLEALGYV